MVVGSLHALLLNIQLQTILSCKIITHSLSPTAYQPAMALRMAAAAVAIQSYYIGSN